MIIELGWWRHSLEQWAKQYGLIVAVSMLGLVAEGMPKSHLPNPNTPPMVFSTSAGIIHSDGQTVMPSTDCLVMSLGETNGWITTTLNCQDGPEFHIMATDGSEDLKLKLPTGIRNFTWNPDGVNVALVQEVGNQLVIGTSTQEGHGYRQITNSEYSCYQPAFSPSGSQLAFICDQSGQANVMIANPDGSDPRIVTRNVRIFAFSWSPDSQRLAVSTQAEDGSQRIFLVASDDPKHTLTQVSFSPLLMLTEDAQKTQDTQTDWSEDGQEIYILRQNSDGSTKIVAVPVSGKHSERTVFTSHHAITAFQLLK